MFLRILAIPFVVAAAMSPSCGSSSDGSTSSTPVQNFQSITVNAGPANNYFNGAFTSVTICPPGSSACQTVGGILVDTGSSGLRVLSSALTVALPQQTDPSGAPVVECGQFLDGYTWGPVQTADIKLGGEQASSVPIQVIGGPSAPAVPAACASTGAPEDNLNDLGANGILGVGLFRQDCGSACSALGSFNPGFYYACPASGCVTTPQSLTRQLQNPVWMFPTDNNGVLIQLPALPAGGAATSTGMMIFGIGTQSDNALGSAKVLTVDANGTLSTSYGNRTYSQCFLDSGSNGLFYLDSFTTGLPLCPDTADFYCPSTLQAQSATIVGVNGTSSVVSFNVGNIDTLNGNFSAFNEVAGPNANTFDWGLSFFFGRTVFTAIEGQSTPGGTGPYFAF